MISPSTCVPQVSHRRQSVWLGCLLVSQRQTQLTPYEMDNGKRTLARTKVQLKKQTVPVLGEKPKRTSAVTEAAAKHANKRPRTCGRGTWREGAETKGCRLTGRDTGKTLRPKQLPEMPQGMAIPKDHPPGSQASSRGEAKDSALLSSRDAGLLEPPDWPQGSPASSSVSQRELWVALESLQGIESSSRLGPMQGTQVQSLVQEDPTCCRATKPTCHSY